MSDPESINDEKGFPAWYHPLERDRAVRDILRAKGKEPIPKYLGWYALRSDWDYAAALPTLGKAVEQPAPLAATANQLQQENNNG